ncbi:MAG: hypothetical protein A2177_11815 [Spirochaetes bacterium RBG_13_68_11]|nr:MAG: hypothetical protein A2177_11815 [Spirochaetes bacterium RBG_13_68_11]
MRTRSVLLIVAFLLCAFFASAADLTIDMQVNTAAKDYACNYLTFKGANNSVDKDQFVLAADGTTGASKLLSTELFNSYRFDVRGKKTMPGALRSLLLYPVADDGTRTGDNLQVSKAADGTITVRYVHRGTAYEIVTDKTGSLVLPTTTVRQRKIGHTDNQIHADFSSNGKASGVDWAKVWNASIADGKQVGSTTSKTGKIGTDVAESDFFVLAGTLKFTYAGNILKIAGELNAVKK